MPDDIESNYLEVAAEFREFVDSFDFTIQGVEKSLGRDLATTAALAIGERTVADQKDATGGSLKPLNPKYRAWKRKKHGVEKIGVLTHQMLSEESLLGKVTITPDEITMVYGTDTKPVRFYTGMGEVTGKEPTDRQKAQFFTDSGRPFYALDDTIGAELVKVAQEALDRHVEENK